MKETIRVIVKRPGEVPETVEIRNNLAAMQKIVEGPIEAFRLFADCAIICNEEGKLRGMPYNFDMADKTFVGPAFFVGTHVDNFTDCPIRAEDLKVVRPSMWEV